MSVEVAKTMLLKGCQWEAIDSQLGYGCAHSYTQAEARVAYLTALSQLNETQADWAHNPHFNSLWDQIVMNGVSFDCRQLPLLTPVADEPWLLACKVPVEV